MKRFLDWGTNNGLTLINGVIFILMTLILLGCAWHAIPPSEDNVSIAKVKPSPGKALVCFYHEKRFLGPTKISLGVISSPLKHNSYVLWEVSPGTHHLEFYYRGILSETVKADISCEAEQVCYFHLIGHERATHEIVQAEEKIGQIKSQAFTLMNWFKEGGQVVIGAEPTETQPQAEKVVRGTIPTAQAGEQAVSSLDPVNVQGQYYALVIGIDRYQHLDQLVTAANDAQALADLLQDRYGFQVQIVVDQDATRERILNALNAFHKTLSQEDNLLIYYSGRCMFDQTTQTAYWLPVDAEPDSDTQWIMTETIAANLNRLPANHVLIVADSCYSGTLERAHNADLNNPTLRNQYLKAITDKRSRVLITSGEDVSVVDANGTGHSPFAQALLDGLTNIEQDIFTAEELFVRYLEKPGESGHLPAFQNIRNAGHESGDFMFKKQ